MTKWKIFMYLLHKFLHHYRIDNGLLNSSRYRKPIDWTGSGRSRLLRSDKMIMSSNFRDTWFYYDLSVLLNISVLFFNCRGFHNPHAYSSLMSACQMFKSVTISLDLIFSCERGLSGVWASSYGNGPNSNHFSYTACVVLWLQSEKISPKLNTNMSYRCCKNHLHVT